MLSSCRENSFSDCTFVIILLEQKRLVLKKIFIIISSLFLFISFLPALDLVSTQDLLLSYLENDVELQKLTLNAQKAELSEQSVKIDNGFDVSLSSGTVTIKASQDGTKITAKPKAEAELPQASNLSLSAETSFTSTSKDADLSDTTFSASVDIISDKNATRKVSLLKAQRTKLEAKRDVNARAIAAEKEFYSELKGLLSSINTIIKNQSTLYSDTIAFEQVKAKGYSSSSSTYRLSQMKVLSDQHTVDSGIKELIHDYVVFYKKCGYDLDLSGGNDIMNLLPKDIENVEEIDVTFLDKELFTKIESAKWTNYINSLERDSKKSFSLSVNGGYTIDNSITSSDTVNAGLTGSYQGLSLGAQVLFPVGSEENNPSFSLTASISLNTFRKAGITAKQNELLEEQELLDIQSAENSYKTYIVSARQSLEQLKWEQSTTKESLDMYVSLEKDLATWYKNGIISESEYLSAKTSLNQYKVETEINKIDLLIYNDEVKANFVCN